MLAILIELILGRTRFLRQYLGRRFDHIDDQLFDIREALANLANPDRAAQAQIDAMTAGLNRDADLLNMMQDQDHPPPLDH